MKTGYVQTSPVFGNKDKNFSQVRELLSGVKADLIVLPELFATGYTFVSREEAFRNSESTKDRTFHFLVEMSEKTGAAVVGGFIELENNKIYNSSMMVFGDKLIGVYRKLHLFYKENSWFSPGDIPLKVYEVNGYKIGVMICFDWVFPEVMRSLALLGAEVIAHPSNLVMPYCQDFMRARCFENRVFAVTANRTGRETRGEDDFIFTGSSQVTSFDGTVLRYAPSDKIHVDVIDIDIQQANNKKINSVNDLFLNRRPEYYKI